MAEPLATEVERHPRFVLVRVHAESIDEQNLEAISAGIAAAGSESPHLPVAVDLGRVHFMPSMSLGGLVQLSVLFRSRQQRLALVNVQPSVRETLLITKLDRLFEIHQDLPALQSRLS